MAEHSEPPRPLASALVQAAPELDPMAEPSIRKRIAEAQEDAEKAGYDAGVARAESERSQLQAAFDGIDSAITEATRRDAETIADLALAVAGSLIGREIAGDGDHLRGAIAEAVASLSRDGELIVWANPEDLAFIGADVNAKISPKPTLARGEFIVESPTSIVDARIAGRLDALRSRLIDLVRDAG